MHVLDTLTVMLTGLMVGNELAVSVFMNPALRQLESAPRAHGVAMLARSLGRAMPVWYGVCLMLLALESFLHRREDGLAFLLGATTIWAVVIVFTIAMLVPINQRLGEMDAASPVAGWQNEHARWDRLHRIRVLLLGLALLGSIYGLTL